MSDRPSPPPGPGSEDSSGTEPAAADSTSAEPTAAAPQPDDTTVLPEQPAAAPDPAPDRTPVAATTEAQAYDPAAYAVPAYGAPVGPPPQGPRGWWGQATSTGGGKAALVTAGVLGAVLLLAGVALLGGLVGRAADWGRHDRIALSEERQGRGWMDEPGQQRRLDREQGDRMGPGEVQPGAPGTGRGNGMGQGGGMGMGRGTPVLGGDVLHGEYTTSVNGTPTVVVVQTGEVRTYTSGRSLTVRSSDGFEATYSLDDSVVTSTVAARLVTGAQVRVVAAKEGMKVTRLAVVS